MKLVDVGGLIKRFQYEFYDVGIPFTNNTRLELKKLKEDGISVNNLFVRNGNKEKNLPLSFGPYSSFQLLEDTLQNLDQVTIYPIIEDPQNVLSEEDRKYITENADRSTKACMRFILTNGFKFKEEMIAQTYQELDDEFKKRCDEDINEMINTNLIDHQSMIFMMKYEPRFSLIFRIPKQECGILYKWWCKIPVSEHSFKRKMIKNMDLTFFTWNILEKLVTDYHENLQKDSSYLKSKGKSELSEKTQEIARYYNNLRRRLSTHNQDLNEMFSDLRTIYSRKYDDNPGIQNIEEFLEFIYQKATDPHFILPIECAYLAPEELVKLEAKPL